MKLNSKPTNLIWRVWLAQDERAGGALHAGKQFSVLAQKNLVANGQRVTRKEPASDRDKLETIVNNIDNNITA